MLHAPTTNFISGIDEAEAKIQALMPQSYGCQYFISLQAHYEGFDSIPLESQSQILFSLPCFSMNIINLTGDGTSLKESR